MASVTTLRVYADGDHSFLVWQTDAVIPGCRGFAIHRRRDGQDRLLDTYVGFAGDTAPAGTLKPSNVWPIQKFTWSDYMVRPGDTVEYRVVPVVGAEKDHLAELESGASAWSPPRRISASCGPHMEAFFNRGVVATQWLARRLGSAGQPGTALRDAITTVGNPIREFLGGHLIVALRELLAAVERNDEQVFAALFELNDPELIEGLSRLGAHAHVILANGASPPEDENASARRTLREAGVEVFDRMVRGRHLDHHKFLVVCDQAGRPSRVLTGSTNWTDTGLCTQSNNAIVIADGTIASAFRDQWDRLKAAGDGYPSELLDADAEPGQANLGPSAVTTWFAPVHGELDLADAREHIVAARQGILFLMFNPGPSGTLLNDIVDRATEGTDTFDPNLYVHGVLNQDPSTAAHPLHLFNAGAQHSVDFEVALPAAVDSTVAFWLREILKLPEAHAMVHSKCVVIDPFGDRPVVMTGSHNMGPKASGQNDDNLVVIRDAPELAQAYAVYIMGIFDQYWWRFRMKQRQAGQYQGLQDDDAWQQRFRTGPKAAELAFWLGA